MRIAFALTLLVSGCLGQPLDESSTAPGPQAPIDADASVATWTGCQQWHLHFDARAQEFATHAPPGFAVTQDEAGMTTLFFHVTFCPNVQEAALFVPVEAPPQWVDPERSEVAVVQIFYAGHDASLYPQPFQSKVVHAEFELSQNPVGPTLTISGGEETTTLDVALHPTTGSFGSERWARFAYDGAGLGVVRMDGNESTNVGFGPVAYTHEGPGGAPPMTAGVAHLIQDAQIEVSSEVVS